MRKCSIEELELKCQLSGVVYHSGYINADEPFNYICSCGNITKGRLGNIVQGKKCSSCGDQLEKLTTEIVQQRLLKLGLILVGEYINSKTKVRYICRCGGLGHTDPNSLYKGGGCGQCIKNNHANRFMDRGCEIIQYLGSGNITYRCSCGNIHTTSGVYFRNTTHNCPKCYVPWNKGHDIPRPRLYHWKKALLLRDNYNCQNCNCTESLHAHHIEAWSVRPDLGLDLNNGIILCSICHKDLHDIYGWQVGRDNLNLALGYEFKPYKEEA